LNPSSGQRDALAILAAQVWLLLASLATQAVLAWLLLPEGRGLYALFAAIATILPVVFTFGLDRSIQYHLMSGRIGHDRAMRALLTVWAAAATCAAGAAIAMAGRGTLPAVASAQGLWVAGLALIAAASLYAVLLRMHIAAGRFGGYLAATIAQSVLNVVLLLSFAATGHLTPVAAVAALALSYAFAAIVSLRSLHAAPTRLAALAGSDASTADIVRYGLNFYPALLGHAVDFNAGVVVLAALATNVEVGIFAAVSALMLKFLLLAQAFQEAMLPRIAADQHGRAELVAQLARIAIILTFAGGLLFAVVSRPVLSLLLSHEFAAGAGLVWWMLPGIAIHAGSTLLLPFFEGTGRPRVVSLAIWAGLLANVLVIVVAFPHLGLDSAGLALTVAMLTRFVLLAVPYCRITGLSPSVLLGLRRVDWQMMGNLSRQLRAARG
jgi:O-antigen/teichoic acid export membrane protein